MNRATTTIEARAMLAIAIESCNIAWVFLLVLSGTFFDGIINVAVGPLFSFCGSVAALLSFCLLRNAMHKMDADSLDKYAAVLFLLSSLLLCCRADKDVNLPLMFAAFFSGIGVLVVVLGGFRRFALSKRGDGESLVVGSLLGGTILFIASQAMTPVEAMLGWGISLPLVSGVLSTVACRLPRRSLQFETRRSQHADIFEKRSFAGFACASGFLLGFCYNAFPKSFRFIGSYGHPLFGFFGEADASLLLSVLVMACLIVVALKAANRNAALIPVAIVGIISFAFGLAFSLSFLRQTWVPAVLLLSISLLACGVCVTGYVTLSMHPRVASRGTRIVIWLLVGLVFGSAVAFVYIARTIPLEGFSSTLFDDAVLFDGTALMGFAVMVVTAFLSFWYAKIPDKRFAPGFRMEPLDVVQRCGLLSEQCELSPREREILVLLAQGRSGPYIQEELCIARSTVKTHVRHIYDKVGVTSRQELLDALQRMG